MSDATASLALPVKGDLNLACVSSLRSLAVIEVRQGEGIGRDLVGAVVARCG